jgi:hypothetical protein
MQDSSRPLGRHGLPAFFAGAVAAGLVFTTPAYADDEVAPAQPQPIETGMTVVGQVGGNPNLNLTNPNPQLAPPNPLKNPQGENTNPQGNQPFNKAELSTAPKVITVPPYTIKNVSGTFTSKIATIGPVNQIKVLSADSLGQPIDSSRVRLAYQIQEAGSNLFVFYPGTGRIEGVSAWPVPYSGVQIPGKAIHPLSTLFGDPTKTSPELEYARQVAVGIALAVMTVGAVYVVGAAAVVPVAVALPW